MKLLSILFAYVYSLVPLFLLLITLLLKVCSVFQLPEIP